MQMQEINGALAVLYGDTPIVCGSGPVPCAIMMVGEAPGAREIEKGTPFCGQAGGNLEGFLHALGLPRAEVYITNVCKFRPTRIRKGKRTTVSNRTPTAAEVREAVPFLLDEIGVVDPQIIITLGNTPLRAVTGQKDLNVGSVHGICRQAESLPGRCIFPLYHPASLIYNPGLRAAYDRDIALLEAELRKRELLHG